MERLLLVLLLLCVVPAPSGAAPAVGIPDAQGPKLPALSAPVAVVDAFVDEEFSCARSAPVRTATIDVPSARWNRVVLEFGARPDGDPWDRLFGVAIGGVEVLRGTTPRTAFTVRKDITEFAALLPAGGTAEVALYSGSFVGRLLQTVRLSFHDEAAPPARTAADAVVPAVRWVTFGGAGTRVENSVTFPGQPPSSATAEITLSGHGNDEAWFARGAEVPGFTLRVNGTDVAHVRVMPYTYAFFGFGNTNANRSCAGPGTSSFGDTVHPLTWWTAQQGLDAAGIHTGVGEIPPYRAIIAPEHVALLAGARTVTLEQVEGGSYWPASVSFILR